jgi:hypothetical protein
MLYGFIGFVISILSSLFAAFITVPFASFVFGDTIMHFTAFAISYLTFFGIERFIRND